MKLIPLDTKVDYFCTEDGKIFKGKVELKGWKHKCWIPGKGYSDKIYMRYGLIMKNGKVKQFYGHRLVAFTYHSLETDSDKLVRHLSDNSLDNHKDKILPGTHEENQTIDRIESGNYMNRGGKSDLETNDKDLPF